MFQRTELTAQLNADGTLTESHGTNGAANSCARADPWLANIIKLAAISIDRDFIRFNGDIRCSSSQSYETECKSLHEDRLNQTIHL